MSPLTKKKKVLNQFKITDVSKSEFTTTYTLECNQCSETFTWKGNPPAFCPNCGAEVDEDRPVVNSELLEE